MTTRPSRRRTPRPTRRTADDAARRRRAHEGVRRPRRARLVRSHVPRRRARRARRPQRLRQEHVPAARRRPARPERRARCGSPAAGGQHRRRGPRCRSCPTSRCSTTTCRWRSTSSTSARLHGVDDWPERADELIERFDLGARAEDLPSPLQPRAPAEDGAGARVRAPVLGAARRRAVRRPRPRRPARAHRAAGGDGRRGRLRGGGHPPARLPGPRRPRRGPARRSRGVLGQGRPRQGPDACSAEPAGMPVRRARTLGGAWPKHEDGSASRTDRSGCGCTSAASSSPTPPT